MRLKPIPFDCSDQNAFWWWLIPVSRADQIRLNVNRASLSVFRLDSFAPYLANLNRGASHGWYARQRTALTALGMGHHTAVSALQRDLSKLDPLPTRHTGFGFDHLFKRVNMPQRSDHNLSLSATTVQFFYDHLQLNLKPHLFIFQEVTIKTSSSDRYWYLEMKLVQNQSEVIFRTFTLEEQNRFYCVWNWEQMFSLLLPFWRQTRASARRHCW